MKNLFLMILALFALTAAALPPEAFSTLPKRHEAKDGRLLLHCLYEPGRLNPAAVPPGGDFTLELSCEQLKRGPKDSHLNVWIDGRRFLVRNHSISWFDGKQEHPVASANVYRNGRSFLRFRRGGDRTIIEVNGSEAGSVRYPAAKPRAELMLMNLDMAFDSFATTAGAEAAPPPPAGSVHHAGILSESGWRAVPFARFSEGTLTVAAGENAAQEADEKAVGVRDVFGRLRKAGQKVFITERGIDLSALRGCEIELSVRVKSDTPRPPLPWEGVRIVLNYATPTSAYSDCCYNLWGTFDWREITFRSRIPSDLTGASLTLGLISDTGSAAFRDLRLTVTEPPRTAGLAPVGAKKYTGRPGGQRLRGFNSCANILRDGQLPRYANEWNANIFKTAFRMPPPEPEEAFEAALEKQFEQWDELIRQAAENRVSVILEVYPSKWRSGEDKLGNTDFFYYKPGCAEKLVKLWERIAERYRGNRTVYAFELLNESVVRTRPEAGMPDYPELMDRVAQAVNRIDPERTLLVQPEEWWGARAFGKLRPIKAKNVVYALHFYMPFALTHQDLERKGNLPCSYPGEIRGRKWDKEALRRELLPVIEFQRAYNVHILVSEFSCIRWSPGADRWVNDAIELFEENDWDWTFHAVSEWWGWNPEFGPDPANIATPVPNSLKDTLQKFFRQNRKIGPQGSMK